jgi:mono/diheme cytochrome c family protein
MKTAGSILVTVALMLALFACSEQDSTRRDLVLETANSFEEIVDRDLAEGRKVYGKYCSICHGLEGNGDGFNAYSLHPKPRNFADSSFRAGLDSARIIETISSGGAAMGLSPLMPAWGRTLSERRIENACYYVTYLSGIGAE